MPRSGSSPRLRVRRALAAVSVAAALALVIPAAPASASDADTVAASTTTTTSSDPTTTTTSTTTSTDSTTTSDPTTTTDVDTTTTETSSTSTESTSTSTSSTTATESTTTSTAPPLTSTDSTTTSTAPTLTSGESTTTSASSSSTSSPATTNPTGGGSPTITGQACLPRQGVTVVVDFTPASAADAATGPIKIGCAIGEQKTMAAASAKAGFTLGISSGFVCTIDGMLAEPQGCSVYPGAYWSVYGSTTDHTLTGPASTTWTSSWAGVNDTGPLAVGSAILFQVQPYVENWQSDADNRTPLLPLADVPNYQPSDSAAPPSSGQASSDADVQVSAGWLGRQLAAAGGVFVNTEYDYTDWGLTIDSLLALSAAGVGKNQIEATAAKIYASGEAYIGAPGDSSSWARVAKTALALQVAGLDPTTFPDGKSTRNLLAELRSAMNADGSFGTGDVPFTHAVALLALARTEGGVPAQALNWLADQQCATGANKGSYGYSACVGDVDSTALAIQALQGAGVSNSATPIAGASTWLISQQDTGGGFAASGDVNANSTGLAGQALRGLGKTGPATKSATFIGTLTVSCSSLTDETAFTNADVGAIAYDQAGWSSGVTDGVADSSDQWVRATSQGLLALGLPTLARITASGASAALPVAPDCALHNPTVSLSQGVVTPGGTITVSVTGAGTSQTLTVTLHSDPVLLGTMVTATDGSAHAEFTIPADTPPGDHLIAVAGPGVSVEAALTVVAAATSVTSPATNSTATTAGLANTGAPAATVPMAVGGVALVLVGAALLTVTGRSRRSGRAAHRP